MQTPKIRRRAPARITFSTRLLPADADRIDAAAQELDLCRNDLIAAMAKLVLGSPEHRAALAAVVREPLAATTS
jgi:hypothetical protein